MEDWKKAICRQPSSTSISNIANYVTNLGTTFSPIDKFYTRRNEILNVATPTFASTNPNVMTLLLVGLISSVENYYRDIIADLIKICPFAKENSSEKTLNLASIWFGTNNLEKGALENISFADSKNITKNFKIVFSIDAENASNQICSPLKEFSKLCELRHAIVHSGGEISGKNAIKLQLPNSVNSMQVKVDYAEFQEAAAICSSLVCASNLELFKEMSSRWYHRWPSSPAFAGLDLNKIFNQLWFIFYSTIDSGNGQISSPLSKIKTRNKIISTHAG